MDVSVFKLYSIGVASENRKLDGHTLEVCPIETMGYLDGELTADHEEISDEGVDHEGKPYKSSVKSSNSVKAIWLPSGSNRATPPDIRRGERVTLWRFGDNDEYYWTPMGLDDHLRRKETVIIRYSNVTDESTKDLTVDNCYYQEVSTHNGTWTIHTNKSGGEPFAYTCQINAKEGAVSISDDAGNEFEIDSGQRIITLKNSDGCSLVLDKKNAVFTVPENLEIKAKNTTFTGVGLNFNVKQMVAKASTMAFNGAVAFIGALTSNGKNISNNHTHTDPQGGSTGGVS